MKNESVCVCVLVVDINKICSKNVRVFKCLCCFGGCRLSVSRLKLEQCSSHLTVLISQSGRAISWQDQASLEARAQLPDLPVSHISSLGSDCQAQRRLCDRQTVVCGSPQQTWATG